MWIIFLIYLFVNFFKIICEVKNITVIPFTLRKIDYDSNYNSTNFLNDYIYTNILFNLNIGTPSQNITSQIDYNSKCFLMQTQNSETPNDTKLYIPRLSSTIEKRASKNYIDAMNFKGYNESYMIEFAFVDYKLDFNYSEYNYVSILGLDIPKLDSNCPNFFVDIKKKGLINKLIWSFEFINDYEGNFIIGEDLSIYNESKYSKDNFYNAYTMLKYFITFDSIYVDMKNNDNNSYYYINMTQALIITNYGVIIAPHEYKVLIDKLFFNDLIDKNICKSETIKYEFNKKSHAGLDYFVYSCDEKQFTDKNNNYYNKFPELVFSLKPIEHDLIFSKEDLFIHINDKYYFLVIFQTNYDVKEIIWYFGEPFIKKYTFSLNFDANTIGFFFKKENDEPEEKDNGNNNYKNTFLVIILSFEIMIIIALIIVIIIFVKKMKDGRKNRINEINDDNFEYLSENASKKSGSLIN